jgi:excisionase family DNA binding protein
MDPETKKALTEKFAVGVKDASKALGTGPYAVYAGIEDGEIPSFKVGRIIRIPTAWLRRKLEIEDEEPKAAS